MSSGSGQSFGFDKFAGLVGARKFDAPQFGYPMGSAFKDMETIAEASADAGVQLDCIPVMHATYQTYKSALDEHHLGNEHKGAMTKVYERRILDKEAYVFH